MDHRSLLQALCLCSQVMEMPLVTPSISLLEAYIIPVRLWGRELSSLICNFLPLSCLYFLLFTVVVLEEFQEVNLLSVFTDVSSTCPFLKQICFL